MEHIRSECQAEFGFNPYLIVQDCWFDNDSQLKASDVDAVHNWFSAANGRNWSLHTINNRKIGVVAPGFGYEEDPNHPFIDSNHGQTLINGLEGTAKSGTLITLCEGFTDAAETASYWRSKDTTYYDYPNQRLDILRKYSQNAFLNRRMIQAESCDFYNDLSPGNKGDAFREGDLDICKTLDAFGGWNVFDAEAQEWLEWKELPIPQDGQFEIRYASTEPAQIQFVLDDQPGAILSLEATGGEQIWGLARETSFAISENSYHNVKLNIISGKVSLNYFNILGESSIGKVAIVSPLTGERYLYTDTIPFKAEAIGFAEDIQKFEVYIDPTFTYDMGFSLIDTFLTRLPLGTHSVKIKATDESGNFAVDSCEIYIGSSSYIVSCSKVGKGEITFDPPGGTYVEGTVVSVLAQPESLSFFNGWSGDITSDENHLNLVINTDMELTATFLNASNTALKVNFQPDDTPVPEGYLKDTGLEYGTRDNGHVYGWVGGSNNRSRDRGAPDDVRYATLNHMQVEENRTWEMEIANGIYIVYLVMGDPSFSNQINTVNIEGVVKEDLTNSNNFDEHHAVVEVKDNRLTISPGEGADNAKICFVEITEGQTTEVETSRLGLPDFDLKQNYPNPFHRETLISFELQKAGHTRVTVYNAFGQHITTLVDKKMPTGTHRVAFNAANLPSGFYFYRMQYGNYSAVRKMFLLK